MLACRQCGEALDGAFCGQCGAAAPAPGDGADQPVHPVAQDQAETMLAGLPAGSPAGSSFQPSGPQPSGPDNRDTMMAPMPPPPPVAPEPRGPVPPPAAASPAAASFAASLPPVPQPLLPMIPLAYPYPAAPPATRKSPAKTALIGTGAVLAAVGIVVGGFQVVRSRSDAPAAAAGSTAVPGASVLPAKADGAVTAQPSGSQPARADGQPGGAVPAAPTAAPAPAPSSGSSSGSDEAAARRSLDEIYAADKAGFVPNARWLIQLSSKWVGIEDSTQFTARGGHTFMAADILDNYRDLKNRYQNVILLQSTDFAKQYTYPRKPAGEPLWTILYDSSSIGSEADALAWCRQKFPSYSGDALNSVCYPRQARPPYS